MPHNALGPPAHFEGLESSSHFLNVERACSVTGQPVNIEVVRASSRPVCFHLGGFMSEAECDSILAAADANKWVQATTASGDLRQGSQATWLPTHLDDTVGCVAAAIEQLLLTPEAQQPSGWATGGSWENMQVRAKVVFIISATGTTVRVPSHIAATA